MTAAGRLLAGDCLDRLRADVDDASVDLVYLDPPFETGVARTGRPGDDGAPLAFDDRWSWDDAAAGALARLAAADAPVRRLVEGLHRLLGEGPRLAWLLVMVERLLELRRVLRPHGSLYLHCDPTTCHHLRVVLDGTFGAACFLNHVVWLYGLGGSSPRYWPRKHDDLLWYARTPNGQRFEAARVPATSARMQGRTKKAPDWWDIPAINNMARERTGWPTQKPLALLERIVSSSSRPGDVVLDPFCGSGTTLVAAQRLGRGWIGIDAAPAALEIARARLAGEPAPA